MLVPPALNRNSLCQNFSSIENSGATPLSRKAGINATTVYFIAQRNIHTRLASLAAEAAVSVSPGFLSRISRNNVAGAVIQALVPVHCRHK
jgi:hypothetical protein